MEELNVKRQLEKDWKSKVSSNTSTADELATSEAIFMAPKLKVDNLLFSYRNRNRPHIREICAGKSTAAKKLFWKEVSSKVKQSAQISAMVDSGTGSLKCGLDEIKSEVEQHLLNVFHGSYDPVRVEPLPPSAQEQVNVPHLQDHLYGSGSQTSLPTLSNDGNIETDPQGWMDKDFSQSDVKKAIKLLKSGKSAGWDTIPNELSMNAPPILIHWLTILYNRIKAEGKVPRG